MPIIRKIIEVGKTSKGVILPKSWLELIERETGKPLKEVSVTVNDNLTIQPIMPKT
jgi:hypothetical protein